MAKTKEDFWYVFRFFFNRYVTRPTLSIGVGFVLGFVLELNGWLTPTFEFIGLG